MKKLIVITGLVLGLCASETVSAQFYVRIRPAAPTEVIVKPPMPSPHHVWVDGEWRWDNGRREYGWTNGYWAEPEPGRVWVGGHWVEKHRGSKWVPGHWARRR